MQSYMEEKCGKSINWYNRLNTLKIHKKFGIDRITNKRAIRDAYKWVTCACGNMCSIIPRTVIGSPVDSELATLGVQFYHEVGNREYDAALITLDRIEKRSEILIKNQLKKQRK